MKRYEKVHEKINVLTLYKSQKTRIVGFRWQDRLYKIDGNNLITKAQKGTAPVYLFSVSNKKGAYQLRLETETLAWFLEEIIWED
ncbi:hypothetical protein GF389_01480 [Candidatus Dojkabacteria bacterium]|nr:hypothetical protein [Candidatus Dojkabacteria bacterium]